MSRRFGGLAVLAALAFLTVSFLPIVEADHAYSHRFVIYGRVVDVDGNPASGMRVDLAPKDFEFESTCNPSQPNTETEAFGPTITKVDTNDYGEFIFCIHTHGMSRTVPGSGDLKVSDTDGADLATKNVRFNGLERVVFTTITLPGKASGNASLYDESYTVAGRLWEDSGEQRVEQITVFGDTLKFKTVNVTIEYNNGLTATATTRTNGYGDFSIRVPVEARPTSGTVKVVAENKTTTAPVQATTGVSSFVIQYDEAKDPFVTKALIGVGIAAAIVVVIIAGVMGARKMKASRELNDARARSTRKRANR